MTRRNARIEADRGAIANRSRRNWMLIFVVCVTIAGLRVLSLRPPLDGPFSASGTRPQPLVIARAGGAGLRPGNTLLAFAHAAELGADMLQVDVRLTRDNVLVAFDAGRLEQITEGAGELSSVTLEQLRALDAAHQWLDSEGQPSYRGKGVRVPTVSQVLNRFPEQRFLLRVYDEQLLGAEALCTLLAAASDRERVVVDFPAPAAAQRFETLCPSVATTVSSSARRWFWMFYRLGLGRWFEAPGMVLLLPSDDGSSLEVQPALVAAAARSGRAVYLDAVGVDAGDDESLRRLFATGVTGVVTDYPDAALAARARFLEQLDAGLQAASEP